MSNDTLYLPLFHYLQAPAEQDYPDLRWQSLPGPEREQWTMNVHHNTLHLLHISMHFQSISASPVLLCCCFISMRSRPACHILIPSHLGLPPSSADPQGHSGHKYENFSWTKKYFSLGTNMTIAVRQNMPIFSPKKMYASSELFFVAWICVIWHTGNYTKDINSKWDM